jgi:uncharacterized protein YbaR (Trm112 family)
MKPLLLDILACPIDKYYPLKLYILKWETSDSKFSKILSAFHDKKFDVLRKVTKIRRGKDRVDDAVNIKTAQNVILKDELVRKESNLIQYLSALEGKLENFDVMEDYSGEKFSKCLSLIKTDVIGKINSLKTEVDGKNIEDISSETQDNLKSGLLPEIYLLNWFFQFSEIEEGVIHCEKCGRWYPIIETIPQMLPDELRDEEPETQFLKKWATKLPKSIIEKGNPFHLP